MQHVTAGYLKQVWKISGWLYEDQHGFRPAYSCESQVAAVCQDIAVFNFFISNIRHVLNFVCFIFDNSLVSEFYMPKIRSTLFHFHRQVGVQNSHTPAYEDGTECSEKLAYKIRTPGNYPE